MPEEASQLALISVAKAPVSARTSQRAPLQFHVTPQMHQWFSALEGSETLNLLQETEQFLDHHRARGTLFKDWTAAWRTWMRRAIIWAPRRGPKEALDDMKASAVRSMWENA